MIRPMFLLLALVPVFATGCARHPASNAGSDERAQIEADCAARADTIVSRQNPANIYANDMFENRTKNTPLASNGIVADPSQGLAQRYDRSQAYSNCLIDHGISIVPNTGPQASPSNQ